MIFLGKNHENPMVFPGVVCLSSFLFRFKLRLTQLKAEKDGRNGRKPQVVRVPIPRNHPQKLKRFCFSGDFCKPWVLLFGTFEGEFGIFFF